MLTFDQVKTALTDKFGIPPDIIMPDAKVLDLGMDSLIFVELLFEIEEIIGKKIPETAIQPTHVELTVQELCTLINSI